VETTNQEKGWYLMVQVTNQAMDQFEALRDQTSLTPDQAVTLVPNDAGELGFAITSPQHEDEIIERDGKPLVAVPQMLIEPLKNVVIDYVDTPETQGFALTERQP
jgi:Fe-S cluster assembly iron-binding protein IscA